MENYSSCCGAYMNHEILDIMVCPECKEHCDLAEDQEAMEYATITIPTFKWNSIVEYFKLHANIDYTIKAIEVKDDFFKDDAKHKELKNQSNKAFKELKKYEFNQRNK